MPEKKIYCSIKYTLHKAEVVMAKYTHTHIHTWTMRILHFGRLLETFEKYCRLTLSTHSLSYVCVCMSANLFLLYFDYMQSFKNFYKDLHKPPCAFLLFVVTSFGSLTIRDIFVNCLFTVLWSIICWFIAICCC